MEPYIKLLKKFLEWEWYKNQNVKAVFLHCLLKANWKEGSFEGRTVARGSFVSSWPHLAKETSLSVQQVRTAIEKLKSTGEITHVGTSQNSVFTVVKYDEYQTNNTQNNTQVTDEQQTSNRQVTAIEDIKNNITKEDNYIVEQIIIENVVDYLNQKTASHYSPDTVKTQELIIKRLGEGKNLDDFKKVIDVKTAEWDKTEFAKYLRPETLFGDKYFETYLNQKPVSQAKNKSKNSFNNFKSRNYDFDELEKKLINRPVKDSGSAEEKAEGENDG